MSDLANQYTQIATLSTAIATEQNNLDIIQAALDGGSVVDRVVISVHDLGQLITAQPLSVESSKSLLTASQGLIKANLAAAQDQLKTLVGTLV